MTESFHQITRVTNHLQRRDAEVLMYRGRIQLVYCCVMGVKWLFHYFPKSMLLCLSLLLSAMSFREFLFVYLFCSYWIGRLIYRCAFSERNSWKHRHMIVGHKIVQIVQNVWQSSFSTDPPTRKKEERKLTWDIPHRYINQRRNEQEPRGSIYHI